MEHEHANDDHFCTAYSRSTVRRRLYTSRAGAVHAARQLESKFPKDEDGFALGPNFGQIRFVVLEATIDENQDNVSYYLGLLDEGLYERVFEADRSSP